MKLKPRETWSSLQRIHRPVQLNMAKLCCWVPTKRVDQSEDKDGLKTAEVIRGGRRVWNRSQLHGDLASGWHHLRQHKGSGDEKINQF